MKELAETVTRFVNAKCDVDEIRQAAANLAQTARMNLTGQALARALAVVNAAYHFTAYFEEERDD